MKKNDYIYFKAFYWLWLFPLAILLQFCNNEHKLVDGFSNYESTASGVKYVWHIQNKKGKKAKSGDMFTFHLLIQNDRDSLLRNTYHKNDQAIKELPFESTYFIGSAYFKDIFTMLTVGDSISFWINADSITAKTNSSRPPYLKKGSELKYTVKVLKIQSREEIRKALGENLKVQREIDEKLIEEFLTKDSTLKIQKTTSGLCYYFKKEGRGKQASSGDTVTVHYTSKFLNGKVYDSNLDKGPTEFLIGHTLPAGLDEGIRLMKEGCKAVFIIPSELAFGSKGMGTVVPPNAVLIFEIDLINVK